MRVVSFINYKGGVGKTTITANIGAGLAARGKRVLLVDLDPQANLTFSVLPYVDEQSGLADEKATIKLWFEAHANGSSDVPRLSSLITTPPKLAELVEPEGHLDLLASHLSLLEIDMKLAGRIFTDDPQQARKNQIRIHRVLADAFEDEEFGSYDYILIDCAPDFGVVTRIAMVASNFVVVPAKADHLSTVGMVYLVKSLKQLITDHNGLSAAIDQIAPQFLGVIFNMVNWYGGQPIASQQNVMKLASENIKASSESIPIFDTLLRTANRTTISSTRSGVPAVLSSGDDGELVAELNALTDEFIRRIERSK